MKITEDEVIQGKDLQSYLKTSMQFEYCTFKNCDFTANNLSGFSFLECEFQDCDLSRIELIDCSFKQVWFKGSKLMGLRFDQCNSLLLEMNFHSCILDYSSFYQLKLNETSFVNCSCENCDFTEADMQSADFSGTDLLGATFDQTNLEKVNFHNATGLLIDPEKNRLKGAKFNHAHLPGLLQKYGIVIQE